MLALHEEKLVRHVPFNYVLIINFYICGRLGCEGSGLVFLLLSLMQSPIFGLPNKTNLDFSTKRIKNFMLNFAA